VSAPSSGVRGAAGCGWRCGGEQLVLSHQAQHAPQGSAYAAEAQPRPHLAVAFAVEGRFLDRAPDLADELLIAAGLNWRGGISS